MASIGAPNAPNARMTRAALPGVASTHTPKSPVARGLRLTEPHVTRPASPSGTVRVDDETVAVPAADRIAVVQRIPAGVSQPVSRRRCHSHFGSAVDRPLQ